MRIDEGIAECAIRELGLRLINESEDLAAEMVVSRVICADVDVVEHREWRGERGIPMFRATLRYKPSSSEDPMIGDYIQAKVSGTFKEKTIGLEVDDYSLLECETVDLRERHVRAY